MPHSASTAEETLGDELVSLTRRRPTMPMPPTLGVFRRSVDPTGVGDPCRNDSDTTHSLILTGTSRHCLVERTRMHSDSMPRGHHDVQQRNVRSAMRAAQRAPSRTAGRAAMLALVLLAFARIEQVVAGTPHAMVQQLAAALRARASTTADGSALVSALVLLTEALTLYLLLTITLHALSGVAGAIGRWAAAVANVATLPMLARSLEFTLGGALAVEVLLTAAVPPTTLLAAHLPRAKTPVQSAACLESRPRIPQGVPVNPAAWAAQLAQAASTVATATTPRTTTTAPLPSARYTVAPGDSLWTIAARHLEPDQRSPGQVARAWKQLWALNHATIGDHPSRIQPGMILTMPPVSAEKAQAARPAEGVAPSGKTADMA